MQRIIREIDVAVLKMVGGYGCWSIGLANNVAACKKELAEAGQNIECWLEWETDSMQEALQIEHLFRSLGMRGEPRKRLLGHKTVYLYIALSAGLASRHVVTHVNRSRRKDDGPSQARLPNSTDGQNRSGDKATK